MTTGIAPHSGFQTVDGDWLNAIAGGQNASFVSGITAAGTTQATSTPLLPGNTLIEVDTAAASTGVSLPPAIAGTELSIYNNGANTLAVYPAIANNPITGIQDTINNGTSLSGGMATHTSAYFFCAKNGIWAAK